MYLFFKTENHYTMNIWYQTLTKPPFTPPATYFPIAWSILYTLMTVAFFLVLSKPNSQNKYIAIKFSNHS